MHAVGQLSQSKPNSRFLKVKEWLFSFRPHFRDWRFWAIQVLVTGIAAIHDIIEINGYLPHLGMLYFLPISLFFLPVAYAAMNFGLIGSIATATCVVIITIPNWVFWHDGLERFGVIFQTAVLIAVAILMGQRVDREKSAKQRAKAYATLVIKAHEEERLRIARVLHDESIQTMILLCRELDIVNSSLSLLPVVKEKVQEARKTAEQAAKYLRDFARALRPPILEDFGIVTAISRLLTDFLDRTKTEGHIKIIGKERRLPGDLELAMFRIAQVALSNVERHSGAKNVDIIISFADKEVTLEIRDNGKGFTPPAHEHNVAVGKNLGIIGMKERAELLGGRIEIQSSLGTGTRIKASIPLSSDATA
ncbi:MAG: sensor histidine kinase [Dehalococcoidales bacterium]|nr:sensor histidine kinase [Dehalococcoidales bacterium]